MFISYGGLISTPILIELYIYITIEETEPKHVLNHLLRATSSSTHIFFTETEGQFLWESCLYFNTQMTLTLVSRSYDHFKMQTVSLVKWGNSNSATLLNVTCDLGANQPTHGQLIDASNPTILAMAAR